MDLDQSSAQPRAREFLAVVLAGYGNDLFPLTSDHGEEPCPKALLPVANKPMIDYTFQWLFDAGINDILLICPSSQRAAISHHIHSDVSSSISNLRIDLHVFDESPDSPVGTCALMRQFAHRITEDFILLPCDFIPPPSFPLSTLLDKFRTDAISNGAIATSCWFESRKPDKGTIPDEWEAAVSKTTIVWDDLAKTLLHVETPDEADRNGDEVSLRMGLLSKHPRSRISTKYQDSDVYVCKRCVLDALNEKHALESFREEFFPWLCKLQYQKTKRDKYGKVFAITAAPQALALKHSTLHVSSEKEDDADSVPASPSQKGSADNSPLTASLRIGLVLHKASEGPAARVNNLASYLEMNRAALGNTNYTLPTDPKDRALIDSKAQISPDSLVGESTKVAERATIKKSIIGKHCVIGKMAKVVGCILLDHCVVAEGAKLEGSILGKNTKIGSRADVSKCVTQAGYEVNAGETVKHEKLDVSDWTAPGAAEDDSEEAEEEEGDEEEDEESDE